MRAWPRALIACICLLAFANQLRADTVPLPMPEVVQTCSNVKAMIAAEMDTQFKDFVTKAMVWRRRGYRNGYKNLVDTLVKRAEKDLADTCKGVVGNCTPELVSQSVARTLADAQKEMFASGRLFTKGFAISFGIFVGATVLRTVMEAHPFLQSLHIAASVKPILQSIIVSMGTLALTTATVSFQDTFKKRVTEDVNTVTSRLEGKKDDITTARDAYGEREAEPELWFADKVVNDVADLSGKIQPSQQNLTHAANDYIRSVPQALLAIVQVYLPANRFDIAGDILAGQALLGKAYFDHMDPATRPDFVKSLGETLEPFLRTLTPEQSQIINARALVFLKRRYSDNDIEAYFQPWLTHVLLQHPEPSDLTDFQDGLLQSALAATPVTVGGG